MKTSGIYWLVAGLAAACVAFGCVPNGLEENWGRAHRANTERQIAHPNAGELSDGHEGLDGRTVEQTMDNYRRDQNNANRRPDSPSIINIGTGPL